MDLDCRGIVIGHAEIFVIIRNGFEIAVLSKVHQNEILYRNLESPFETAKYMSP